MLSSRTRILLLLALILSCVTQLPFTQDMASRTVGLALKNTRVNIRSPTSLSSSIPAHLHYLFPSISSYLYPSTRFFSAVSSNMAASKPFLDAVKDRRTLYKLAKESTISDARIEELVEQAILHVPSSFNSQSTRLVVLLKKDHEKVWDFTRESLAAVLPEEQKEHSLGRLDGFHAAYGTVSNHHIGCHHQPID